MPQNRDTGEAGRLFGIEFGAKIGSKLGGSRVAGPGNEFVIAGKRVAIKCAKQRTNEVGVTHLMLKRVDGVIAAFQIESGEFEIYRLDRGRFVKLSQPSRSASHKPNRVLKVTRLSFRQHGESLGRIWAE